jgi:hypothetical protein
VPVGHGQVAALLHGEERRPAQQLLDKGSAYALRAGDDGVRVVEPQVEAVAVEGDQAPPADRVGERYLGGLVYAPWSRGERGLEQVGAVGREHEDDVGVLGEAVHLVQELEEQRVLAQRTHAPFLGHEVHVLEDDRGRLEVAG